jgi:methionyl aminopeptidase
MHNPPDEQIKAGKITAGALALARQLCMSPITGKALDREIETFIRDHGGEPALKGYSPPFNPTPYQHSICLSVGCEVVHGLPEPRARPIQPDDLITVDLVVGVNGWHTDAARTFSHSQDKNLQNFIGICHTIFRQGTSSIKAGLPLRQYGNLVETLIMSAGYQVIDKFCGHGIGKEIHQPPQIPNTNSLETGFFKAGQSYAIEPIISELPFNLTIGEDGWTYIANCLNCHFENTIWVGMNKTIILTEESV